MALKVDPSAPLVPILHPLAIVPGNYVSTEAVTLCIKEKLISLCGVSLSDLVGQAEGRVSGGGKAIAPRQP